MMKKITSLTVALLLVAGVFGAVTASAQSVTDLQAMIAKLQAQIAALSGGSASTGATAFTQNLTVGSKGAEVSALQELLNTEVAAGLPVTGYFGPMTKAAVIKFQVANGVPGTGYVGPLTRTALNALKAPATGDTGSTGGDTGSSDALTGGAGSVDEYTLVASVSNEEVGEDQKDAKVLALDIEADDNSDLRLTAVRVVFNEGTANRDFDKYADEVSIWLDGKELARVDADVFTEDNNWTKTISLASGAIVKAGETERLEIAVSGVGNLDSNDAGETWTADVTQVRFVDASGASTSEDPSTATRTFTFTTFATAADVELKVLSGDSGINKAHSFSADATNDTDNVSILSFKMKADGDSDIRITSLPVTLTVGGVDNVSEMISTLYLYMDGEEVASENVSTTTAASSTVITFADVDETIGAGETVEFVVKAKVNDFEGLFAAGDTISAAFGEANTDMSLFVAKDETGTALADEDKTGTVTGESIVAYANDFTVKLSGTPTISAPRDASTTVLGIQRDYTIAFTVTAGDSDIYIATTTGSTTNSSKGVEWSVKGDTYTGTSASNLSSTADLATGSGAYKVKAGETETFTLNVTLTNTIGAAAGYFGINVDRIMFVDGGTTGFAESAAYLGTMANYSARTAGVDVIETTNAYLNTD